MKGRILIMKMMPQLNLLVKEQILTPAELKALTERHMRADNLTPDEVVADLYSLDVPEDKAYAFSYITDVISRTTTEGSIFKNPLKNRN